MYNKDQFCFSGQWELCLQKDFGVMSKCLHLRNAA